MKKVTFLTVLLLSASSFAQTLVASYKPVDSKYNWGYLNEKGEILIEPSYKTVVDFNEDGVTPVFDLATKTWKFINVKNEMIDVQLKRFEPASVFGFGKTSFKDGVAIIVSKKKKGVINLKGEILFEPTFDFISPFVDGFATAKMGMSFYVLSAEGEKIEVKESLLKIRKFSEGFAPFRGKNELFGFLNTKGEVVIEPKFLGVGHMVGGVAWAKNFNKQVGYINTKAEWIISARYLAGKKMDPETGMARVKDAAGWKLINKKGNEVQADGAIAYGDFHDGVAFARQGKKFGYVDAKGEWIVKASYLKAKNFNEGFAAVRTTDKWGFINKKGEMIFEEQAKAIRNFKNGFAAVQNMQGLWGFINTKGEWVIEAQYTRVRDFHLVK